jgi:hypothetical protein
MMDVTKQHGHPRDHESKSVPKTNHVSGTHEGNALVQSSGREAGRRGEDGKHYRSARDSTSINPEAADPLLPEMPNIPPA